MAPKQYAIILDDLITEAKGEDIDKIIGVFVGLLKKNNDLRLADKIIKEFEAYQKEKKGIRKITVSTARSLSGEIKKELEELGEVEEKKDPSLIGGMKIRVGDMLVDGSIRKTLGNLRIKLSE